MNRRIPSDVQSIFQKYVDGNVRRLNKEEALGLLKNEFQLEGQQAEQLFDHFDTDKNGYLSLWEFQHFYNIVGNRAAEIVSKFEGMDLDKNGYLDKEEARKGLQQMKTSDGQNLDEKEIEFFIKTTAGENDRIDLGEFADLLARLKLYHRRPTKK